MTEKLLNSRLSAITPDPTQSFLTWIQSVWTTSTGYTVPLKTAIKFDTKFGSGKGFYNFILVEEMPKRISPQIIGGSRYTNEETKRVQIMCIGTTAKTTKWNIERHLESIINGNLTAMQGTYGIDWIQLTDFNEIPTSENDGTITNLTPNTGFQKARSTAQLMMRWESEASTA